MPDVSPPGVEAQLTDTSVSTVSTIAGHHEEPVKGFGEALPAIVRSIGKYLLCWFLCAGLLSALIFGEVLQMDDHQRFFSFACFVLELAHGLNACVVKETRHWLFSQLDGCVWHTLLFMNMSVYFRTPEWYDVALYIGLRAVAENMPNEFGGLMWIKARRRTSLVDAADGRPVMQALKLAVGWALWYVLTIAVMLRMSLFDVVFLISLPWGLVMTVWLASYYLYTKDEVAFYVAHMANLVSQNPALFAALFGFSSGQHLIWDAFG